MLVGNPGTESADVTLYGMTEGGERELTRFALAPGARNSVRLNDFYEGSISTRVQSDRPVTCDRSVYWNNRGGGTCSIGFSE